MRSINCLSSTRSLLSRCLSTLSYTIPRQNPRKIYSTLLIFEAGAVRRYIQERLNYENSRVIMVNGIWSVS